MSLVLDLLGMLAFEFVRRGLPTSLPSRDQVHAFGRFLDRDVLDFAVFWKLVILEMGIWDLLGIRRFRHQTQEHEKGGEIH